MTVKKAANGTEGRNVFNGTLATGETIGVHESMQPVGTPPVDLHRIGHSELIVVQEGTVAFEHDGKEERVGPGGLVYVAFGTVHRIKECWRCSRQICSDCHRRATSEGSS